MKTVFESRTPYALLGFLTWRPMSGYDLKQVISRSIGSFWAEGYGQIYPMLRRLSAVGWISKVAAGRSGNRARNVYEITVEGREALQAWLNEPALEAPPRIELLLKLFFGGATAPAVSVSHVTAARDHAAKKLAEYRSIADDLENRRADNPQAMFWRLTVEYGVEAMCARLQWCNRALDELRRLEKSGRNAESFCRNRLDRPAESENMQNQKI